MKASESLKPGALILQVGESWGFYTVGSGLLVTGPGELCFVTGVTDWGSTISVGAIVGGVRCSASAEPYDWEKSWEPV